MLLLHREVIHSIRTGGRRRCCAPRRAGGQYVKSDVLPGPEMPGPDRRGRLERNPWERAEFLSRNGRCSAVTIWVFFND